MALEIDGFAVFHSIGSHRAAFVRIAADMAKSAQTLVAKAIKDRTTDWPNCEAFGRRSASRPLI